MKKTLFIIAAVSMLFAACNKEEVKPAKKGMTMTATVQEDSKATLENDNTDNKKYHFKWETDDAVYVYNPSPSNTEYQFVNNGTSFLNNDAEPAAGTWKATYPKKQKADLYIAGQKGTLKTVADKYLLYGSTTADATQTKLYFEMKPACAVLKITTSVALENVSLTVTNTNPKDVGVYNVVCNILPDTDTDGYVIDLDPLGDSLGDKNSGLFSDFGGIDDPLPADSTYYYVIPSINIKWKDKQGTVSDSGGYYLWINYKAMNNTPKNFEAGKVYTLTY